MLSEWTFKGKIYIRGTSFTTVDSPDYARDHIPDAFPVGPSHTHVIVYYTPSLSLKRFTFPESVLQESFQHFLVINRFITCQILM
jgi:hypothetical protein